MKTSNIKRTVLLRTSHFVPHTYPQPTGQGTGLGLSLSYDIVKAHGGELKVETMEGASTTFIIKIAVA